MSLKKLCFQKNLPPKRMIGIPRQRSELPKKLCSQFQRAHATFATAPPAGSADGLKTPS